MRLHVKGRWQGYFPPGSFNNNKWRTGDIPQVSYIQPNCKTLNHQADVQGTLFLTNPDNKKTDIPGYAHGKDRHTGCTMYSIEGERSGVMMMIADILSKTNFKFVENNKTTIWNSGCPCILSKRKRSRTHRNETNPETNVYWSCKIFAHEFWHCGWDWFTHGLSFGSAATRQLTRKWRSALFSQRLAKWIHWKIEKIITMHSLDAIWLGSSWTGPRLTSNGLSSTFSIIVMIGMAVSRGDA